MSGAFGSFICSVFSLGLLPLGLWPLRWRTFAVAERRELIQLAQWWRPRVSPSQASRIDSAVHQLNWSSTLSIVPLIVLAAVGSSIGWLIFHGFTVEQIVKMTYSDHWRIFFWWNGSQIAIEPRAVWMTALLLGYGCQWMAVRSHAIAVDSLAIAVGSRPGAARSGLNILWIASAVIFCAMRVWWGVPMVLAGAMQRRYVRISSPQMRAALTQQIRRSATGPTKICRTYRCGARLSPTANFCPRCGAAVQGEA